ncbi:uncharacterized protein B0T23DRAFT_389635 [Neurospora hispaniola]|uniref:Transposase n=1 Tax=Neurospora hispaniola TaxID=588809 RepID=A0AAJ0MMH5_9PEZI|nr:hypothetical protein B0T23DRAFT_389635 [Neurospora hispaniola]
MPGILDTPKKARIKGALFAANFLKSELGYHQLTHRRIAGIFAVNVDTVDRINKDERQRTGPSENGETRGRKRKVTPKDCDKIIQLYEEYPDEAPDMPWVSQLQNACDKEASHETIMKAMRDHAGYNKRVACEKEYVSPRRCEERCSHCKILLEKYDQPDFLRIRYYPPSFWLWHCY